MGLLELLESTEGELGIPAPIAGRAMESPADIPGQSPEPDTGSGTSSDLLSMLGATEHDLGISTPEPATARGPEELEQGPMQGVPGPGPGAAPGPGPGTAAPTEPVEPTEPAQPTQYNVAGALKSTVGQVVSGLGGLAGLWAEPGAEISPMGGAGRVIEQITPFGNPFRNAELAIKNWSREAMEKDPAVRDFNESVQAETESWITQWAASLGPTVAGVLLYKAHPVVGRLLSTGFFYKLNKDEVYDLAISKGADPGSAQLLGMLGGTLNTALDIAGVELMTGFLLKRIGSKLLGYTAAVSLGGFGEGSTEGLQAMIAEYSAQIAGMRGQGLSINEAATNIDWEAVRGSFWKDALLAAPTGALFGLASHALIGRHRSKFLSGIKADLESGKATLAEVRDLREKLSSDVTGLVPALDKIIAEAESAVAERGTVINVTGETKLAGKPTEPGEPGEPGEPSAPTIPGAPTEPITIPALVSTESAHEFGTIASTPQLLQLRSDLSDGLNMTRELYEAGEYEAAMQMAFSNQFKREALEAAGYTVNQSATRLADLAPELDTAAATEQSQLAIESTLTEAEQAVGISPATVEPAASEPASAPAPLAKGVIPPGPKGEGAASIAGATEAVITGPTKLAAKAAGALETEPIDGATFREFNDNIISGNTSALTKSLIDIRGSTLIGDADYVDRIHPSKIQGRISMRLIREEGMDRRSALARAQQYLNRVGYSALYEKYRPAIIGPTKLAASKIKSATTKGQGPLAIAWSAIRRQMLEQLTPIANAWEATRAPGTGARATTRSPYQTPYKYLRAKGFGSIPGTSIPYRVLTSISNAVRSERKHPFPPMRKWLRAIMPHMSERYWYQRAGAVFDELFKRVGPAELERFIKLISVTSKSADPVGNMTKAWNIWTAVQSGTPLQEALDSFGGISKKESERIFRDAATVLDIVEDHLLGTRSGPLKLSDYMDILLQVSKDPSKLSDITNAVVDRWMNIAFFPGKAKVKNLKTGALQPGSLSDIDKERIQVYLERMLKMARKSIDPNMQMPELQAVIWSWAKSTYAQGRWRNVTNYPDWFKIRAAPYLGKSASEITDAEALGYIRLQLSVSEGGSPDHLSVIVFDHYISPERFKKALRGGGVLGADGDLIVLDAQKGWRGTGQPGRESARHALQAASGGIKMMHLYPHTEGMPAPLPEMTIRGGKAESNVPLSVITRSDIVYDLEADPLGLWRPVKLLAKPDPETVVAAEKAVLAAGYIGIRTRKLAVFYSTPQVDTKVIGSVLRRFSIGVSPAVDEARIELARKNKDTGAVDRLTAALDAQNSGDYARASELMAADLDAIIERWPSVRLLSYAASEGRWIDESETAPKLELEGNKHLVSGAVAELAKRWYQNTVIVSELHRDKNGRTVSALDRPASVSPLQEPSLQIAFSAPLDTAQRALVARELSNNGIPGAAFQYGNGTETLLVHHIPAQFDLLAERGTKQTQTTLTDYGHATEYRNSISSFVDTLGTMLENGAALPQYKVGGVWFNNELYSNEWLDADNNPGQHSKGESYDLVIRDGRAELSRLVPGIQAARHVTGGAGKGERVPGGLPANFPIIGRGAATREEISKRIAEAQAKAVKLPQPKTPGALPGKPRAPKAHKTYEGGAHVGSLLRGHVQPALNVWVKQSSAKSNAKRVLLTQISSNLMRETDSGDAYYSKLYNQRNGYDRPTDFWEVPEWIGVAANSLPVSDLYVIRDTTAAVEFLNNAGYRAVMFSAMDTNKVLIKQIAQQYTGKVIVGGYVKPEYFAGIPNIEFFDSMPKAVKSLGYNVVPGADYRHFKGTKTIPRLTMSQGCLHHCAFCTVPKTVKAESKASVTRQLDAFSALGYRLVYLNDKTFGQAKNYADLPAHYTRLKAANKQFDGFIIQTTATAFNKLDDQFLRDAGIRYVELGVESYNDSILEVLNKPAREKHIDEAVTKMRANDIGFIPNIIAGVKEETQSTYKHTIEFLERNADIISHVNLYNLALYEGTKITESVGGSKTIGDIDENSTTKSFHDAESAPMHEKFYADVSQFAMRMLDKGDLKRTIGAAAPGAGKPTTISGPTKLQTRAYHGQTRPGVPITRFDPDKIGTGAGNALGWGAYISEEGGVGKYYAEMGGGSDFTVNGITYGFDSSQDLIDIATGTEVTGIDYDILHSLYANDFNKEEAIEDFEYRMRDKDKKAIAAGVERINSAAAMGNRHLYEVELEGSKDLNEMTWLEWEKPLREQNLAKIKAELEKNGLGDDYLYKDLEESTKQKDKTVTGSRVYKWLSDKVGSPRKTSEFLARAGIDGTKAPVGYFGGGTPVGFKFIDQSGAEIGYSQGFMRPLIDAYEEGSVEVLQNRLRNWISVMSHGQNMNDPDINPADLAIYEDLLQGLESGTMTIQEDAPKYNYAIYDPSKIRIIGHTQFAEPALAYEGFTPRITSKQLKRNKALIKLAIAQMRAAGMSSELLAHVDLRFAPFISLKDKDFAKSYQEHGGNLDRILGATTPYVRGLDAEIRYLVELSMDATESEIRNATWEEAGHVILDLGMTPDTKARLLKHFGNNEESAMSAFVSFMNKPNKFTAHPSWIRKLFLQIRAFLQRLGNAIKGQGFSRPEDYFAKMFTGYYSRPYTVAAKQRLLKYAAERDALGRRTGAADSTSTDAEVMAVSRVSGPKRDLSKVPYSRSALSAAPELVPWQHSQLQHIISTATDMPGKSQSLIKWLERKQVKPSELDWMDIPQWLADNTDKQIGKFDKEALKSYIAAHEILIDEVEPREEIDPDDYDPDDLPSFRDQGEPIEPDAVFVEEQAEDLLEDVRAKLLDDYEPDPETGELDPEDKQDLEDRAHDEALERAWEYAWEDADYEHVDTVYGYTIYARHNFGEASLVDPDGNHIEDFSGSNYFQYARDAAEEHARDNYMADIMQERIDDAEPEVRYGSYQLGNPPGTGAKDYTELLFLYPAGAGYQSDHWDLDNVLAHVRYSTRFDRDGIQTLFIDEIQSDWLQDAKQLGFKAAPPAGYWTLPEVVQGTTFYRFFKGSQELESTSFRTIEEGRSALDIDPDTPIKQLERDPRKGVPRAPLLANWHEFVFKRMLRMAAEGSYSRVAWTTGIQQINRYTDALRQQVDKIEWSKSEVKPSETAAEEALKISSKHLKDTYGLSTHVVHELTDTEVLRYKALTEEEHRDVVRISDNIRSLILKVDNEHATRKGMPPTGQVRIIASKADSAKFDHLIPLDGTTNISGREVDLASIVGNKMAQQIRASASPTGSITGSDLSIGGHGMKVFYDEMLPGFARKYGRQWKAEVGTTEVMVEEPNTYISYKGYTIVPVEGSADLYRVMAHTIGGTPVTSHGTFSKAAALKEIEKQKARDKEGSHALFEPVHYISVTPQMRDSVLYKGQTMFAVTPNPPLKRTVATSAAPDTTTDPYATLPDTVRAQLESSKEFPLPNLRNKLTETAIGLWHMATRHHKYLDPTVHGQLLNVLRLYAEVPENSRRLATNQIRAFVEPLTPNRYSIFNMHIIIEDMVKDIESGLLSSNDTLPFGFESPAMVRKYLAHLVSSTKSDPAIQAAYEQRQAYMTDLKQQLVDLKLLPKELLEDDRYFHHQVLEYMGASNHIGSGVSTAAVQLRKKGWQKARSGSIKNYNTDYLTAEHEVIAQSLAQIETKRTLNRVRELTDIKPSLALDAQNRNTILAADIIKSRGDTELFNSFTTPAQRNKYIKEILGNRLLTWKDIMREHGGYVDWRPAPNTAWYVAHSITDRMLEEVVSGQTALSPEVLRDVRARGADEVWAVPEEVAATLNSFQKWPDDNTFAQVSATALSAWKKWVLINPYRVIKYNINNMSGDADISFAYDPKIMLKYFPKATRDLWPTSRKGKTVKPELRAELDLAYKLGVIGSGWSVQEVVDIARHISFEEHQEVMLGKKPNIAKRYWRTASRLTTYRENILRLAAFRYFQDQIAAGATNLYGASNRSEIDQITDPNERAAKLSRDLVGDYGNLTEAGQWIRAHLIPFYSWMEINAPRYVRLMRNLKHEGKSTKLLAAAGAKKVAWSATKLGLKASTLSMVIMLWNLTVFPDEEDELGESQRRQMHIILGKRADGSVITLRFQGALSDALAWFGGEDLQHDIRDVITGKETTGAKLIEAVQAPFVRLGLAIRPEISTTAELVGGRSFWPDPRFPRAIRDKWEHIARTFSLQMPYKWAMGKPKRGDTIMQQVFNDALSLGFYSSDPGESAYYDVKRMIREYTDKLGIEHASIIPTSRSSALYYYKQSLKYGDLIAARKYLAKYKKLGGADKGLKVSISAASPLASLKKSLRWDFKQQLSPREYDTYLLAVKWYDNTYKKRRHGLKGAKKAELGLASSTSSSSNRPTSTSDLSRPTRTLRDLKQLINNQ